VTSTFYLDGLFAFLLASALGSLFILGILVAVIYSLIRAHRTHEPFIRQRLFPHAIGMSASLLELNLSSPHPPIDK
jgi:hypothetical protein